MLGFFLPAALGAATADGARFSEFICDDDGGGPDVIDARKGNAVDWVFEHKLRRAPQFSAASGMVTALAQRAVGAARSLLTSCTRVPLCVGGLAASHTDLPGGVLDDALVDFANQITMLQAPSDACVKVGHCLGDVLRSSDTIHGVDFLTVEPYDEDRLTVVSDEHRTVPLRRLLDDDTRVSLDNFNSHVLCPDAEDKDASHECPRPYVDPALKDYGTASRLMGRLVQRGLGVARKTRKCIIGFLPFLKRTTCCVW